MHTHRKRKGFVWLLFLIAGFLFAFWGLVPMLSGHFATQSLPWVIIPLIVMLITGFFLFKPDTSTSSYAYPDSPRPAQHSQRPSQLTLPAPQSRHAGNAHVASLRGAPRPTPSATATAPSPISRPSNHFPTPPPRSAPVGAGRMEPLPRKEPLSPLRGEEMAGQKSSPGGVRRPVAVPAPPPEPVFDSNMLTLVKETGLPLRSVLTTWLIYETPSSTRTVLLRKLLEQLGQLDVSFVLFAGETSYRELLSIYSKGYVVGSQERAGQMQKALGKNRYLSAGEENVDQVAGIMAKNQARFLVDLSTYTSVAEAGKVVRGLLEGMYTYNERNGFDLPTLLFFDEADQWLVDEDYVATIGKLARHPELARTLRESACKVMRDGEFQGLYLSLAAQEIRHMGGVLDHCKLWMLNQVPSQQQDIALLLLKTRLHQQAHVEHLAKGGTMLIDSTMRPPHQLMVTLYPTLTVHRVHTPEEELHVPQKPSAPVTEPLQGESEPTPIAPGLQKASGADPFAWMEEESFLPTQEMRSGK